VAEPAEGAEEESHPRTACLDHPTSISTFQENHCHVPSTAKIRILLLILQPNPEAAEEVHRP